MSVYFHTSSAFVSIVSIAVGAERQHESREHELIDKYRVMFVGPVVVTILVHGNAAEGRNQVDAFRRLVIAAQFDDEHAAVAIECDLRGIFDHGLGENGRQAIARRQPELLDFLLRSERQHRGLRREIGGGVGRIAGFRRGAGAAAAAGGLDGASGRILGGDDQRQNRHRGERENPGYR